MDKVEKWEGLVSIVIPAYNEQERILPSIRSLAAFCENHFKSFEIICVDDGSTDGTWGLITGINDIPSLRPLRLPENRGKGSAVKHGMLNAKGDYRFFTDADLPYRLDAFNISLQAFHLEKCDMVAGDRDLIDSAEEIEAQLLRRFAGRVFSTLVTRLVRMDVTDSQCGFKGFSGDAATKIFSDLRVRGYAFDVEIFSLARSGKLKVCRIPVTLVRQAGSKIRLSRDPFRMVIDLIRLSFGKK